MVSECSSFVPVEGTSLYAKWPLQFARGGQVSA